MQHWIEKQTIEMSPIEAHGPILDIGGGGEGIIGKLNGRQVVSIDPLAQELKEVKNDSVRIVMDARELRFLPDSFEVVTSFFTLMYIRNVDHQRVFREVRRVLEANGRFLIWDVKIPKKCIPSDLFAVPLHIVLPWEAVDTGYGTRWGDEKVQDLAYVVDLATDNGFEVVKRWSKQEIFHLELTK